MRFPTITTAVFAAAATAPAYPRAAAQANKLSKRKKEDANVPPKTQEVLLNDEMVMVANDGSALRAKSGVDIDTGVLDRRRLEEPDAGICDGLTGEDKGLCIAYCVTKVREEYMSMHYVYSLSYFCKTSHSVSCCFIFQQRIVLDIIRTPAVPKSRILFTRIHSGKPCLA